MGIRPETLIAKLSCGPGKISSSAKLWAFRISARALIESDLDPVFQVPSIPVRGTLLVYSYSFLDTYYTRCQHCLTLPFTRRGRNKGPGSFIVPNSEPKNQEISLDGGHLVQACSKFNERDYIRTSQLPWSFPTTWSGAISPSCPCPFGDPPVLLVRHNVESGLHYCLAKI